VAEGIGWFSDGAELNWHREKKWIATNHTDLTKGQMPSVLLNYLRQPGPALTRIRFRAEKEA